MGRLKKDVNVCRACKMNSAQSPMATVNGKPRGICITCRRNAEKFRYWANRWMKPYVRKAINPILENYNALSNLKPGVYPLCLKTTQEKAGFVLLRADSVYMKAWNRTYDLHLDLIGLATFLGNKNLIILPRPSRPVDGEGKPIPLETLRLEKRQNVDAIITLANHKQIFKAMDAIKEELGIRVKAG